MRNDKVTVVDEPYICCECGQRNLKFTQIAYSEGQDGQIVDSTVLCLPCFLKSPMFLKIVNPDKFNEYEKLIKKQEYNCNRRMLRRVLRKEKKV